MKRVNTAIVAGGVAAFFLFPASSRAQPRPHRLPLEIQNCQFHKLTGVTVENHDGEKLGKIKDFAMDVQSGQAKYAVISTAGIISIGSHLKVVPARAVSTATAKKGIASLDISERRWAKAPLFRKSDLAHLNEPTRAQLIARFYAHSTPDNTPTGRVGSGDGHPQSAPLQLASDLVEKEVVNHQGETLGRISDLLIDLTGKKPAIAIISIKRFLKKDQSFAVLLSSLGTSAPNKFTFEANRQMFQESQLFDQKAWDSAGTGNGVAIYRFETR